jgi:hypothetical protein
MSNDKFRVWEFKNKLPKDADILVFFGLNNSASGAGAADPSAIDFSWHQKNFEDAIESLLDGHAPAIDVSEGRCSVAFINAI